MAEPPVIDASPLIYLSRTGHLALLQLLGARIVVPEPVADEIHAKGRDDAAARALAATPWLQVVPPLVLPPEIAIWDLGAGEASVLAWARSRPGTIAILDDLQGRRCAFALGVPVLGTLGLVLLAKRRRVIPAARPVIEGLVAAGMYLSETVLTQALALVEE